MIPSQTLDIPAHNGNIIKQTLKSENDNLRKTTE